MPTNTMSCNEESRREWHRSSHFSSSGPTRCFSICFWRDRRLAESRRVPTFAQFILRPYYDPTTPSAAAARPQAGKEHRRWANAHNLKLHLRPMRNSPRSLPQFFQSQRQPFSAPQAYSGEVFIPFIQPIPLTTFQVAVVARLSFVHHADCIGTGPIDLLVPETPFRRAAPAHPAPSKLLSG